jgi:hypothetical protein
MHDNGDAVDKDTVLFESRMKITPVRACFLGPGIACLLMVGHTCAQEFAMRSSPGVMPFDSPVQSNSHSSSTLSSSPEPASTSAFNFSFDVHTMSIEQEKKVDLPTLLRVHEQVSAASNSTISSATPSSSQYSAPYFRSSSARSIAKTKTEDDDEDEGEEEKGRQDRSKS